MCARSLGVMWCTSVSDVISLSTRQEVISMETNSGHIVLEHHWVHYDLVCEAAQVYIWLLGGGGQVFWSWCGVGGLKNCARGEITLQEVALMNLDTRARKCVCLCVCVSGRVRIRARFCSSHFMSACRSFRMRCCLCLCGVSVFKCVCLCVCERERARESEWMCERVRNSLFVSALSMCVCMWASECDRLLSGKTKKAFNSVGNNNYNHVYLRLEWL